MSAGAIAAGTAGAVRFSSQAWDALGREDLYAILALRQEVFCVEQKSAYLDCDGLDAQALHLCGAEGVGLVAYARVFAPGVKYDEASIGRVVVRASARGTGLGRRLVREALAEVARNFGRVPVRISAQRHLERFYEEFGFVTVSGVYLEDAIEHVAMRRD